MTRLFLFAFLFIFKVTAQCQMRASKDSVAVNALFKNNKSDSIATKIDSVKNKLDTTVKQSFKIVDSTNFKFNIKNPIPKRAAMYSALLPGLGQAYNKQYYKIAIVYAGLGVSAYLIATEYNKYQKYQEAYVYRTDNNPLTIDSFKQYNVSDLNNLKTLARSNLDKIVVYSAVWYGLNIIDALASAHLKTFDMSKSISLKATPFINNHYAGITACITLKTKNNYAHSSNRIW
jgi:Family of unknown function (DUF5683)